MSALREERPSHDRASVDARDDVFDVEELL